MSLLSLKPGLAGVLLGVFALVSGQNGSTVGSGPTAAGPAWDPSAFQSSPPVYPSPNITGAGNWTAALEQASSFVAQLTLAEKAELVTGTTGPCVGNIGSIPRLGFHGLCLQDGPLAIRQSDYSSVFPAGITVAASWDRNLAYQRGVDMGAEFRGKGAHIALGPVAGPLGRSGLGGRNWEGFSPDPYLTGEMFGITIEGMQSTGLQACAKHYIAYEQETQRNPSVNKQGVTIDAVSSNLDDRTMHELYLWPFANAIHSGVASVMCSYNRINGSYACQNSKTLNGLLKEELGFQGYVMSDWGGTHSGDASVLAGLDMDMPGPLGFGGSSPASYFGGNITASVKNGSISEARVNDMCLRIMTPYFYLQQQSAYPPIDASETYWEGGSTSNYLYNYTFGPANVDVRDNHATLIRQLGSAGSVLLKNVNNTLPLKQPLNVAVLGNDAGDVVDGLYFGDDRDLANIGYEFGVLPVGGGSGTGHFTYIVSPLEAIKAKVASYSSPAIVQYVLNNTLVINRGGYANIYPQLDVCLVFLKTWATEGYDRPSLLVDWNGTALVQTVAASCRNTVVITNSPGINILPFADHPNVTAIIANHYPGQEVGNSIVDILWGNVNPSGKLPYTIAYNQTDYNFAPITNSSALLNTSNPNAWQSDFEERLLIDYRHFDYFNVSPQYEFGFGLSYTTFSMADALTITPVTTGSNISALPPSNPTLPGGNPALWDVLFQISVTVTNTGSVAGAAVPQLYLGLPQPVDQDFTPVKVLRGFEKVYLQPGQSEKVAFALARRDLSYWDIVTQQWTIGQDSIKVYAGFSSRDIKVTAEFSPLSYQGGSGGASGSGSVSASGSVSGTPSSSASGAFGSTSVATSSRATASASKSTLTTVTATATSSAGYGWTGSWTAPSWPRTSGGW